MAMQDELLREKRESDQLEGNYIYIYIYLMIWFIYKFISQLECAVGEECLSRQEYGSQTETLGDRAEREGDGGEGQFS